ncbi:hypothetical protein BGX34_004627 [Mortierella sp. NVP85]|nr:hypothetical protein BGX34_004627 [Mortierella sp. NVP85]
MSRNGNDAESQALPYPEEELEYHDLDDNAHPPKAPSGAESPRSSMLSFLSTSSNPKSKEQEAIATARLSTLCSPSKLEEKQQHSQADDSNESFDEYEIPDRTRRPFYRRRTFWWICGVTTILFLAIGIPLFLIVIMPKIAQLLINGSTMEIMQLNMTNPQERSVQGSMHAALVGMPALLNLFAAKVEFVTPVQVYWVRGPNDEPKAGQMTLGAIEKAAFAPAEFTHSTMFEIEDPQLFGEFAKVMLSSEQFLWRVMSKIDVTVIGRTIKDLNIDKVMGLNGLKNFNNLKVLSFDIPSDAPNGEGVLVSASASIVNPSPVGMSLGFLEIEMNLKNTKLGRVSAKDIVFVGHQASVVHFEGIIYKQTDPAALEEVSTMISNYLANMPTPVSGQGVSVLPDGVHPVSWMTAAIVSTKMTLPLSGPPVMEMLKEVIIKDMSLVVTEQQPWAPVVASSSMSARFQLPFNMSFTIMDIWDPKMTLGYQNEPIADIYSGVWNRTNSDIPHNIISFTLPPAPVSIRPEGHDAFANLITALTQQDSALIDIDGSAKSVALTPVGQFNLTVPLKVHLPMQGVNFNKLTPSIGSFDVASATVNCVIINATIIVDNPTIFAVEAGPVTLHIKATLNGVTEYIGYATVSNLKMGPGRNSLSVLFRFQPQTPSLRDNLLTEYIAGRGIDAVLYGDKGSSPIASLAPVIEKFNLATKVPGMTGLPNLIIGGRGSATVTQFLNDHMVTVQAEVLNPLSSPLWAHELKANVTWKGYSFGSFHIINTIVIKSSGVNLSPPIRIGIPTSYQFWMFMLSTFIPQNPGLLTGAKVFFDLDAEVLATVGGDRGVGFEARARYSQKNVGMSLVVAFSPTAMGSGMRKRKRSVWVRGQERHEIYEESYDLANELGPEPDKEDLVAYLEWLKKAVRLSYPDEAAADGWSMY